MLFTGSKTPNSEKEIKAVNTRRWQSVVASVAAAYPKLHG